MTEYAGRTRSRDGGNLWMMLLIALALIATVIMLISDSAVWLQIALLAALWAAILGFLLVTRTRNDRDAAQALLDAERREHAAELEALYARNDADRAAEGLPPVADLDLLREIREELANLRAQLEDLSGREFGYEPAALQAEARRVREIESRTSHTVRPEPQQQPRAQAQQQPRAQAQQQPRVRVQQQQQPSRRWQGPGAEDDTSIIEPVRDQEHQERRGAISALQSSNAQQPPQAQPPELSRATARQTGPGSSVVSGAPSSDAVAGRVGSHRAPEGRNPLTDLIRERQEEIDREQAAREAQQKAEAERRERAAREQRQREEEQRRQREEAQRRQREEEQRQYEEQQRRQREEEYRRRREEAERAEQAQRAEREARERREAEERRALEPRTELDESRGRRRADENRDGSLTVAELLARSRGNR
nr:Uncharacterised protein [Streptococcus thermophilus]